MDGNDIIELAGQGSLYIREMYVATDTSTSKFMDEQHPNKHNKQQQQGSTSNLQTHGVSGSYAKGIESISVLDDEEGTSGIGAMEVEDSYDYGALLKEEDENRVNFIKGIATDSLYRSVRRNDIFEELYQAEPSMTNEYPLSMRFVGENAIDLGGVSRDVMSAFWEVAYERLFDGSSLLVPVVNPHTSLSLFTDLGKILSHGYLSIGFLPVRICFPSLAAMVFGTSSVVQHIEANKLVESLIDYLSDTDRAVIIRAMRFRKNKTEDKFPPDIKDSLLNVLSLFGIHSPPTPSNLLVTLADIGRFAFLLNPMSAIATVYSGIPESHKSYWGSKTITELATLFNSLTATAAKVLSLIEEPMVLNRVQQRTFGYLRQYVGNMTSNQVRSFLRFITGSTVCNVQKLEIRFNTLSGLARRPIGHTCGNSLELSATYVSYTEFEKEFNHILLADSYTWEMDAL